MAQHVLLSGGLVKVSQAAKRLAIDRNTLYHWMQAGKIPYTCVNGVYRIPSQVIDEMLARGLNVGAYEFSEKDSSDLM